MYTSSRSTVPLPVGARVLYLAAVDTYRVAVVLADDGDGHCLLTTRRAGVSRVEAVPSRLIRLAA